MVLQFRLDKQLNDGSRVSWVTLLGVWKIRNVERFVDSWDLANEKIQGWKYSCDILAVNLRVWIRKTNYYHIFKNSIISDNILNTYLYAHR